MSQSRATNQIFIAATSFTVLFSIVGLALYGLPFYYDYMVSDFGWSRTQVTSGNALSKLVVGPFFGFFAGWIVDRFGPRRLMFAGIVMAGLALIGLGSMSALWMFYAFYLINALGYVCGGPLPNQILLSQWFDRSRGKAMGFAYLGIGVGGAAVPLISYRLTQSVWMAYRPRGAGRPHHCYFTSDGSAHKRKVHAAPPRKRIARARIRRRCLSESCVLSAGAGKHVFDWRLAARIST